MDNKCSDFSGQLYPYQKILILTRDKTCPISTSKPNSSSQEEDIYTFPERKDSRVSFCSFVDMASTEVELPVIYATSRCDKSAILFTIISTTLAVMILSTKMRHDTFAASLKEEIQEIISKRIKFHLFYY